MTKGIEDRSFGKELKKKKDSLAWKRKSKSGI